jgi:hypothetical protein
MSQIGGRPESHLLSSYSLPYVRDRCLTCEKAERSKDPAEQESQNCQEIRIWCEQLQLWNYDESPQHWLTVSVWQPNGGPAYEATYDLAPDDVASELEIDPPGQYEVHVSELVRPVGRESPHTIKRGKETASCNVGYRSPQPIVVECGNGVVTLSEGLSG